MDYYNTLLQKNRKVWWWEVPLAAFGVSKTARLKRMLIINTIYKFAIQLLFNIPFYNILRWNFEWCHALRTLERSTRRYRSTLNWMRSNRKCAKTERVDCVSTNVCVESNGCFTVLHCFFNWVTHRVSTAPTNIELHIKKQECVQASLACFRDICTVVVIFVWKEQQHLMSLPKPMLHTVFTQLFPV